LLERHRIDDLIVIDDQKRPVGIVDSQDSRGEIAIGQLRRLDAPQATRSPANCKTVIRM